MSTTCSAVPYTYCKRGVYYFGRGIPSDVRMFYRSDRVIQSLHTMSLYRTSGASEKLLSRLYDYWLDLRLKQTDVTGSYLLEEYSSKTHGTTVRLYPTLGHVSDVYKRTKVKGSWKSFSTHTDGAVSYAIQFLANKDLNEYATIDTGEFRDYLFAKSLKRSSVSRNLPS